jgi:hypothetical protein
MDRAGQCRTKYSITGPSMKADGQVFVVNPLNLGISKITGTCMPKHGRILTTSSFQSDLREVPAEKSCIVGDGGLHAARRGNDPTLRGGISRSQSEAKQQCRQHDDKRQEHYGSAKAGRQPKLAIVYARCPEQNNSHQKPGNESEEHSNHGSLVPDVLPKLSPTRHLKSPQNPYKNTVSAASEVKQDRKATAGNSSLRSSG